MNQNVTICAKFVGLLLLLFQAACAGPSTPFGALNFFSSSKTLSSHATSDEHVQISFLPGTQRFHHLNNFQIELSDDRGFSGEARMEVFYNGREVSDAFSVSKSDGKMTATFKDLRLNPRRLHDIKVAYYKTSKAEPITKIWTMPTCDLTASHTIQNTGPFEIENELKAKIQNVATIQNINPSALAGLIAQESGFNNKAVSVAKALGMTQVTHIAEEEIANELTSWPKYPGIRKLSFLQLKYHILNEDITETNEWRLDPQKSFIGGSLYIKHLLKYWGTPSKRTLLAENNVDLTQAVLASYNIGGAAVSGAIERRGSQWLRDERGTTALKYVQMVGSYCEGFGEESTNEK